MGAKFRGYFSISPGIHGNNHKPPHQKLLDDEQPI
jgi:hypothetical protein